ncbi:sensor domain-containing diguanylate cyclase [Paenibacillus sp. MMO-177]|uniref:sensor domain-containing diguanylate cyclase n=1 Tax=Paenibacillus sp. MMO-177 TaxID=3081289 RepID=UPI003019BDFE
MAGYHPDYKILNSLFEQIAIIDLHGTIQFVNESWIRFAMMNNGDPRVDVVGSNYFNACKEQPDILNGIKLVLSGQEPVYMNEYPCHSPSTERWFLMQVTSIIDTYREISGAVISHINITERKELELRLNKLAMTDPLSGLYNRRYFNIRLQEELAQSKRFNCPLSLICMDIDEFKQINDTYGHDAGDEAILKLASIITKLTRQEDVCARLGGDEFVILLPGTTLNELRGISERILQEVRDCHIKVSHNVDFSITVSIGAVESERSIYNKKTLLQRADTALYKAKEAGRNQVFVLSNHS